MSSRAWDGPTKDVEQCRAPVRWKAGRLQQLWTVHTVTDGNGSQGVELDYREEWRDVPTED